MFDLDFCQIKAHKMVHTGFFGNLIEKERKSIEKELSILVQFQGRKV